jgi:hypothetical protein
MKFLAQTLDGAMPMTDPSQIDHNVLCDAVIRTFEEYTVDYR